MTLFELCNFLDKNTIKSIYLIISSPHGGYKTVNNLDYDALLECGNMNVEHLSPNIDEDNNTYLEVLVRTDRVIKTHPIVNLEK